MNLSDIQSVKPVAQIFNLLYRRVALCIGEALRGDARACRGWQIANLRYSRVQLCATNIWHIWRNRDGIERGGFRP
jgi:hypothetical protein